MRRLLAIGLLLTPLMWSGPGRAADDDDEKNAAKEALQAFNEYIGSWKGSGEPDKARPDPRDSWSEEVSWSWRFKGDDAWLLMEVKKGKYLKAGELRYLPEKKRYQLKAVTADNKKADFLGDVKNGSLTLERVDPDTKETQRLKMNMAGGGIRFVYAYETKPANRTLFARGYRVGLTREGESLAVAAKEKKIECVVSGGLGTIPVTYKGTTYYVCCGGCRDAFNDNPEKYIKEFEAKKAKK
jgi:hypothetical protein